MKTDIYEQIKKYHQLKLDGVLTEEEFERKKQELLFDGNNPVAEPQQNRDKEVAVTDKGSVIFTDQKVKIYTNVVENDTYSVPTNKIGNKLISSEKVRYIPGVILLALGGILFLIGYTNYVFGALMIIGGTLMSMSITWFLWIMQTKYTIELTTPKGKINFVSSKESEYIDKVFSFIDINSAMYDDEYIAIEDVPDEILANMLSTADSSTPPDFIEDKKDSDEMFNNDYIKDGPYKIEANTLFIGDNSVSLDYIRETRVSFNPTSKSRVWLGVLLGIVFILLSTTDRTYEVYWVIIGIAILASSIYRLIMNRYALYFYLTGGKVFGKIISKDRAYLKILKEEFDKHITRPTHTASGSSDRT